MPKAKRLRLFAGPNGSGKSTLFEEIKKNFHVGHFVNADKIEKQIKESGYINLDEFDITSDQNEFSGFLNSPDTVSLLRKSKSEGCEIDITIKENVIVSKSGSTHSYEASLITSFIRYKLLHKLLSFSFETVMSHPSKLAGIHEANKLGFKTYLYFVCLDDPELNISRVQNRIDKGGHGVPAAKIIDRYTKTLNNLLPAIQIVEKAYLFDNSGEKMKLIAEVKEGVLTILAEEKNLPNWFLKYVIEKTGF